MSILGDRLKQYIDESGYTVYRLSKLSDVNRTSIVRMLNSNRIPERENMEKLLPYLKLTPAEKEEVWKLYETMACGEDIFYRREYVLNLMLSLFNQESSPSDPDSLSSAIDYSSGDVDPASMSSGYYCYSSSETMHLIYLLLHSDSDLQEIDIFAPFASDFTEDFLKTISAIMRSSISIRHLVHFVKNPEKSGDVNYNLNVLSKLLPYACDDRFDYAARYLYINTPSTSDSMVPFPFYLLLGNCLVLLSADFSVSYFTSAPNMISYYRELFTRTSAASEPLVNQDTSFEAFVARYRNLSTPRARRYSIELQPPFIETSDINLVEKYAATDSIEFQEFIDAFEKRIKISEEDKKPVMLFSRRGLDILTDEGFLTTIPKHFMKPIEITDRIFLLERIKLICLNDRKIVRMLNPMNFPITQNMIFSVEKDKRVIVGRRNFNSMRYRQIYLTEPTIVESITDFFDYVLEHPVVYSDLVYTKEQTISAIDSCISRLC